MVSRRQPARTHWRAGARLLAVVVLLQGCSLYPKLEVDELTDATAPVQLKDVPFFPQTEFQCGPASLAGVIGAAGVETTPEELSPQVFLPERKGSLQVELLAATRRAGLLPYVLDGEPQALISELEAGRPVLVLHNLRTRHFPVWHFSVLRGFDAAKNKFIFNSGVDENVSMNARTFMRTWNWAERWAMVAMQPGQLPATPDPDRYLEAVSVFESVAGGNSALPAWLVALEQWPADPRPHLAMGNAAYEAGDRREAAKRYRQGLSLDPANAALSNNLASVLGELGCPRAGENVLKPVMSELPESSSWRSPMEQTMAELAASKGKDADGCDAP